MPLTGLEEGEGPHKQRSLNYQEMIVRDAILHLWKKHAQTMLSQQTVPLVKMGTHTIYSYNRYIGSNLTNTLFKDARLKPSRNFTI